LKISILSSETKSVPSQESRKEDESRDKKKFSQEMPL